MHYYLAVFPPLLGMLIVGLFGRKFGNRFSSWVTCTLMGLAAFCSWWIFIDYIQGAASVTIPLFTWFDVGRFQIEWAIHLDTLVAVMIMVVNTVSFLVHVYSIGYMSHDDSVPRFMAYLSLFTFMMLMLVTSSNLIQLFFGWEGVGLASYLLIGFWFKKASANAAAIKAFVVNRVGDLGLVLGMGAIFLTFNTLEIQPILSQVADHQSHIFEFFGWQIPALELICFFLFIGAMGKSAQLGLHTWLPDAMEGPTPVSALIHAATMVTAGVFLLARMSPLFELAPYAKDFVTIVGATTAFFAGTVALTQNDIKRVIAYSTCSQLGYMFFAAGLGAYNIAVFHLMTHAFFKALLFLGSGAVIHAMSDEQDMRKMGGIWSMIPITYTVMWIGSLALAGAPIFAGFYSKDAILAVAWFAPNCAGSYAYILGLGAAFLTAFYSWRLLFMTFHGKANADEIVMSHVHEPGLTMLVPLFVLAIGAVCSGFMGVGYFTSIDFWRGAIYMPAVAQEQNLSWFIHYLPTMLGAIGIGLAFALYIRFNYLPGLLSLRYRKLYEFSLNKWYFDELYDWAVVKKSFNLGGHFWKIGDGQCIDGYGPDGVSSLVLKISNRTSQLQTGYIYHYAFAMVVGIAFIVAYYIWF